MNYDLSLIISKLLYSALSRLTFIRDISEMYTQRIVDISRNIKNEINARNVTHDIRSAPFHLVSHRPPSQCAMPIVPARVSEVHV